MKHPISEASLNRFARGTATREEGKSIVIHLLRGCSTCSRKLQALIGPMEPATTYSEASMKRNRPADHLIGIRGARGSV
ncbi:MAG TPA: hypothetical protein VH988_30550 [Thermoanaerobaculia bacterium]|nr:hypothetical protein [Thermoanaerobaculia bacterium]